MPKGAKKAGARPSRLLVHQGAKSDFTLYDFAHVASTEAKSSGRLKKGSSNPIIPEVKSMIGKPAKTCDSLPWYEKDLSDFDLSDTEEVKEDELEDDEEGAVAIVRNKSRKCNLEEDTGVVWPLDLWFLVSNYIAPEDVSLFARICHGSHAVTHSANFWYTLYRRHFNPDVSAPKDLRELVMDRVHGLRTRVIRCLFLMHPPFQSRLRCTPFENDPERVVGARCVLMWYQRVKNTWHFYFKFHRQSNNVCPFSNTQGSYQPHAKRKKDYLMEDSNIYHNPEDNCCVLQVVANNFISLPVIMGQYLVQVAISVGHGMRFHKVKLVFHSENVSTKQKASLLNGTTAILDPVGNIKVIEWWDPKYPR